MPANCAAPRERYRHLERLAQNGLAEWGVVDPGSAVFTRFDEVARGEAGYTYFNPDDHFREGMRIAADYGVRPSFALYEAGCTRLAAATAAASPKVPTPDLSLHVLTGVLLRLSAGRAFPRCASGAAGDHAGARRAVDGGRPRRRYPAA